MSQGEDGFVVETQLIEDPRLTGNFAIGVIDLKNEQFTELAPEIGFFSAVMRSKSGPDQAITTKEL